MGREKVQKAGIQSVKPGREGAAAGTHRGTQVGASHVGAGAEAEAVPLSSGLFEVRRSKAGPCLHIFFIPWCYLTFNLCTCTVLLKHKNKDTPTI